MSFPEWAPTDLIEVFNKLHAEAENYRRLDAEAKNEALAEDPSSSNDNCYEGLATRTDGLADILFRLLTHHDMQTVWKTLSRPTVNPRFEGYSKYILWSWIAKAIHDFPVLLSHTQTPIQRAKSLKSVIAKSRSLLNAISDDPTARAIAQQLMALYLARSNIEYRQSHGEMPYKYELDVPLTLSSDCNEAWKESRDENLRFESDADLSGQYRWENKPLLARLKFWADIAQDTNFSELIQLFIEFLETESKHPPEIKQPGRGDDSFKPFLIRRLSQHMESLYGQPFDEAVARIASIVLDLEVPLTRDDVRPYITNTGKKFSEGV